MRPPATTLALASLAALACTPPARPAETEARVSSTPALLATGSLAAPEEDAAVPISTADPSWGDRRALVSLVVFGDLECPYTGKVLRTLHALEDKYGPSDLRIVWKDDPLPFHPQARPAAEAAEAVFEVGRSEAFWRFWDLTLSHQTDLSGAAFEGWAVDAGVDAGSYRRALDSHVPATKVDKDLALGQRLHVEGTPTSFVNGSLLVGAQPVAKFTALIDAELAKAKARLAAGVAPDALYADLARTNWKLPVDEPGPDDEKEDTKTVWRVPLGGGPVRGRPDAAVTIVVFSDFQCPYCKRVEPTLKQVMGTYGDKIRIVWRDEPLPFHKHALPAAELAREARAEKGDAGFWAAHDAIFESQPKLEDQDLLALGNALGLDAGRVRGALAEKRFAAQIQTDLEAADDVQANGTPHLFINGRRLAGAQPFEAMKPIIDEEIRHAEDLVAHGTAPLALYDTMMRTAKTAPVGEAKRVPARAGAPTRGPATATVVIEEFADFECPFCTRAEGTLTQIAKRYGARVRFVWRNLPLHTHSEEAAEAALEAQHQKGSLGFWAMHDKLFAHQADHDGDGSGLARQALDGYAREIGLDVAAFDRALDGHAHRAEIKEDMDAAEVAQISGTPSFVVGGYLVAGAQPFGSFRRVIDQVIAAGPAVAVEPPLAAPPPADIR